MQVSGAVPLLHQVIFVMLFHLVNTLHDIPYNLSFEIKEISLNMVSIYIEQVGRPLDRVLD